MLRGNRRKRHTRWEVFIFCHNWWDSNVAGGTFLKVSECVGNFHIVVELVAERLQGPTALEQVRIEHLRGPFRIEGLLRLSQR